jgi:hypothetical protein
MGNWAINIQGVGCHHNSDLSEDANRMARRFVKKLKAAGHHIERADFTHGAKEDLGDPAQEHPKDRRENFAVMDDC